MLLLVLVGFLFGGGDVDSFDGVGCCFLCVGKGSNHDDDEIIGGKNWLSFQNCIQPDKTPKLPPATTRTSKGNIQNRRSISQARKRVH